MPIPDYIRDDPQYAEMILYDGLENAFVGIAYRFTDGPFAVYDRSKVIESIMANDMDRETAEDNFGFNIAGLGAGDFTPIFIEFSEGQ